MWAVLIFVCVVLLSPAALADDASTSILSDINQHSQATLPVIPAHLPAPSGPGRSGVLGAEGDPYEYRIGVRDLIELQVFQVEELNHTSRVNSNGFISVPLLGHVKLLGLNIQEAESLLERKLGEEYLQDPHVTLFIKEFESQRITLEGWAKDPGVYPLKGRTTLMQAIAMGSGLDRLADPTQITIFRKRTDGKTQGYIVSLDKVRAGDIEDPLVYNDDIIVIPQHGGKALIEDITGTIRGFIGFGTL